MQIDNCRAIVLLAHYNNNNIITVILYKTTQHIVREIKKIENDTKSSMRLHDVLFIYLFIVY